MNRPELDGLWEADAPHAPLRDSDSRSIGGISRPLAQDLPATVDECGMDTSPEAVAARARISERAVMEQLRTDCNNHGTAMRSWDGPAARFGGYLPGGGGAKTGNARGGYSSGRPGVHRH